MIISQLLRILFDDETVKRAMYMFAYGFEYNGFKDRYPIITSDFTIRLFKPTDNLVNFEFLVSSDSGRYFKPIAMINSRSEIILFNELKEEYNNIKVSLPKYYKVKFLKIENNAVISAFAKETFDLANDILSEFKKDNQKILTLSSLTKYDRKLFVNGLNCELIFCNQNYPQFFLDDDSGISSHIGAYIPTDRGINVVPSVAFKDTFDLMKKMKLLTAFNTL